MSHEFGTIRISQQGKDQLTKLKRATGIKNWNTLCRWALCVSLADRNRPVVVVDKLESNVEMSWRTFAGPEALTYAAVVVLRANADDATPQDTLIAHIHRGLGHLSGSVSRDDSIESLVSIGLQ